MAETKSTQGGRGAGKISNATPLVNVDEETGVTKNLLIKLEWALYGWWEGQFMRGEVLEI